MKAFQSLFPPLAPRTLTLSSARRVVLISYNPARGTVDWRHFRITVKPYGVSSRVRKVLDAAAATPDLGSERDIADYILRRHHRDATASTDGYESAASDASSAAGDGEEATVDLADDYVGRNNKKGQKRAVRLDEIGPRMELRLVKITEGVPGKHSAVIFHEFVQKSKAEVAKLNAEHAEREKIRRQRREEQERNVARKKAALKDDGGGETQSEEEEDGEGEDVAGSEDGWDEDEEISEGEISDEDAVEESDGESEPEEHSPAKRPKTKNKR